MLRLLIVATNLGGSNCIIPICKLAMNKGCDLTVIASNATVNRFIRAGFQPNYLLNPAIEPIKVDLNPEEFDFFYWERLAIQDQRIIL